MLESADDWGTMFMIEFYVSRKLFVLQLVFLVFFENLRESKIRSGDPDNFKILKFNYNDLVSIEAV